MSIDKLKRSLQVIKLRPICEQSKLKYTTTVYRIQQGTLPPSDGKRLVEALANNGVVLR